MEKIIEKCFTFDGAEAPPIICLVSTTFSFIAISFSWVNLKSSEYFSSFFSSVVESSFNCLANPVSILLMYDFKSEHFDVRSSSISPRNYKKDSYKFFLISCRCFKELFFLYSFKSSRSDKTGKLNEHSNTIIQTCPWCLITSA